MRSHFKTGLAFLTAVLFAMPLTAGAADKSDKASSTMDKATDKAKDTATEAKGAASDSWLTSKTKIALFSDDRVKGKDVRVETMGGQVYLRGKVDSAEAKMAAEEIAKGIEGVKSVKNDLQVVPQTARKTVEANDKQWTEKGRFTIPQKAAKPAINGRIWTHPVIANGKLYLRDQELLFCYEVK